MKIESLTIKKFRNLENFSMESSIFSNFVFLAGKNGSGKSTVLEVINSLLSTIDRNQIKESVITDSEWELKISFTSMEIKVLAGILITKMPEYINTDKNALVGDIKESLNQDGDNYHFTISVKLNRQKLENTNPEVHWNGDRVDLPDWFTKAKSQSLFCTYINPMAGIVEGTSSFTSYLQKPISMNEVLTDSGEPGGGNERGSYIKSVNLGQLLNGLMFSDIWNYIENKRDIFPKLDKTLQKINEYIAPLKIEIDPNEKGKGNILFNLLVQRNNGKEIRYPIRYASSGERQMIALIGLIIHWDRLDFKPFLLFDEPDLHLHPDYVAKLGQFMDSIFSDSENPCGIVIATHSPELISENSDHVYQITSDFSGIQKVDKLSDRIELFRNLGKKFDLMFLAPKVYFVEGVEKSDHYEDYKIYQKLIDTKKERAVFIPSGIRKKESGDGSKPGTIKTFESVNYFLKEIADEGASNNLFVLVDKDSGKDLNSTPFTHIECLYFLDKLDSIKDIFGEKSNDVERFIIEKQNNILEQPLEFDGKKIIESVWNKYSTYLKEKGISEKKVLQIKIIDTIKPGNYPKAVTEFFESIKK